MGEGGRRRSDLGVLRGLCLDLDSVSSVNEAVGTAARWIREAVGVDAVVTVVQPDAAGRLRVGWREGEGSRTGRKRSARRRAVFEAKRAARMPLPDPGDRALGMIPLVSGGNAIGILEIAASDRSLEASWEVLEIIGSQLAIVLVSLTQQAQLRREFETLERASSLGQDLIRARTAVAAVGVAVRSVSERHHIPVAGWCAGGDGQLTLAAVRGLGTRKRRQLRQAMFGMPRWDSLSPRERQAATRRFEEIVDSRHVGVVDVGDALLFAANRTKRSQATLKVVGSLLGDALGMLAAAERSELRNEQLDMGIAWTAHELRGPILCVRAVLELLLQRADADPRDLAIIRRSVEELDQLVGTAEALLGWAVGTRSLKRRRTDIVRIVEEAVESCRLETGEDGVVVLFDRPAVARIDPAHIRAAIVNLLRNALAFAEPGTKVEVVVEGSRDVVMLSVKDFGPEIPSEERDLIFAPFVRGSARRTRNGSGLGLFIARRVVEAHGGRIWVESDRGSVTFHMLLPVTGRKALRFAS